MKILENLKLKRFFKNLQLKRGKTRTYSEVDGLSLQNLFFAKNHYFPNCYMFTHSVKSIDNCFDVNGLLEKLKETYNRRQLQYLQYTTRDLTTHEERMGFCIVLPKKNIFARFEPNIGESYILYGNENTDSLQDFLTIVENFYIQPEKEENNLYKIAQTSAGFCLQKGKINAVENFSIERQYNDDFQKEDNKIRAFLEDSKKSGLVILHGEKGTGKTTYIRNLINTMPDKKFVYVSPDLVTCFGQPSFTSFISTLYDHIIILEDCENVIRDRRNTGSNSAVSTLLNMSDGLLADDLSIKFICTFNANVSDIDSALMRKGRLVSKYEFKPLTVEKTNKLLEFIYTERSKNKEEELKDEDKNATPELPTIGENIDIPQVKKGLTLADIYNFEEESYEIVRKKII